LYSIRNYVSVLNFNVIKKVVNYWRAGSKKSPGGNFEGSTQDSNKTRFSGDRCQGSSKRTAYLSLHILFIMGFQEWQALQAKKESLKIIFLKILFLYHLSPNNNASLKNSSSSWVCAMNSNWNLKRRGKIARNLWKWLLGVC